MENILDVEPANMDNRPTILKTTGMLVFLNALVDGTLYLRGWARYQEYEFGIIVSCTLLLSLILFLILKIPLKITVFKDSGKLQYTYNKLWGSERSVTVDIPTATYSYRLRRGRYNAYMKLVIYNNIISNYVSLMGSGDAAFDTLQLDQIAEAIEKIRGEKS